MKPLFSRKSLAGMVPAALSAVIILFGISSLASVVYISSSAWSAFFKIIRYLCYLLLFIHALMVLFIQYKKSGMKLLDWLKEVLFFYPVLWGSLIISALAAAASRQTSVMILWLLLFCFYFIKKRRLFFLLFVSMAVSFGVVLVLSALGVIDNLEFLRADHSIRYALGFMHPLETEYVLLFILFTGIYAYKRCFIASSIIGVFLLAGLFYFTDARTPCFLGSLILILASASAYIPTAFWNKAWTKKAIYILVISCFIVPVLLALIYNPDSGWMSFLNKVVSGRIELAHIGLVRFGFGFLGRPVEWIGEGAMAGTVLKTQFANINLHGYNYVDCSYVKMLIDYGILYFAMIMAGWIYIVKKLMASSHKAPLICSLGILLLSIMDTRLLQFALNTYLFLMADSLFIKKNLAADLERRLNA